jgi:hypothetical protein
LNVNLFIWILYQYLVRKIYGVFAEVLLEAYPGKEERSSSPQDPESAKDSSQT